MFAWAVPGEAKAFPVGDREAAIQWLEARESAGSTRRTPID